MAAICMAISEKRMANEKAIGSEIMAGNGMAKADLSGQLVAW